MALKPAQDRRRPLSADGRDQRHAARRRGPGSAHHLHGHRADAGDRHQGQSAERQDRPAARNQGAGHRRRRQGRRRCRSEKTRCRATSWRRRSRPSSATPNGVVQLRGDRDAAYGDVVSVMDELAANGIFRIAMVLRASPRRLATMSRRTRRRHDHRDAGWARFRAAARQDRLGFALLSSPSSSRFTPPRSRSSIWSRQSRASRRDKSSSTSSRKLRPRKPRRRRPSSQSRPNNPRLSRHLRKSPPGACRAAIEP